MKTWLRVGLILSGVYLILFLVSFLLDYLMQPNGFPPLFFLLFPSLLLPLINNCLLGGFYGNTVHSCNTILISIILVILNIIFYFFVGSIMGLVKSKDSRKETS
tara:strand:+ start:1366 stop:1677 length:312 start_codon:yes stop_codon:yes gene_type:complete